MSIRKAMNESVESLQKNSEFLIVQAAGNRGDKEEGKYGYDNDALYELFFAPVTGDAKNSVLIVGSTGEAIGSRNFLDLLKENDDSGSLSHLDLEGKDSLIDFESTILSDVKYSYSITSSKGTSVDIAAPGEFILTTTSANIEHPEYGEIGASSYKIDSGSSLAAPFVTGLATLIWQINPNLTSKEVKNIILDSAISIENSDCRMINAFIATEMAITWNDYDKILSWGKITKKLDPENLHTTLATDARVSYFIINARENTYSEFPIKVAKDGTYKILTDISNYEECWVLIRPSLEDATKYGLQPCYFRTFDSEEIDVTLHTFSQFPMGSFSSIEESHYLRYFEVVDGNQEPVLDATLTIFGDTVLPGYNQVLSYEKKINFTNGSLAIIYFPFYNTAPTWESYQITDNVNQRLGCAYSTQLFESCPTFERIKIDSSNDNKVLLTGLNNDYIISLFYENGVRPEDYPNDTYVNGRIRYMYCLPKGYKYNLVARNNENKVINQVFLPSDDERIEFSLPFKFSEF